VPVILVTFTVPDPDIIPCAELLFITTEGIGLKITLEATLNVPLTSILRLSLNPLVLLTFTLLNPSVAVDVPPIYVVAGLDGVLKLRVLLVVYEKGVEEVLIIQLPPKV